MLVGNLIWLHITGERRYVVGPIYDFAELLSVTGRHFNVAS